MTGSNLAVEEFLPKELKGLPREIVHVALFLRNRGFDGTPTPRNDAPEVPELSRRYFSTTFGSEGFLIVLVDETGTIWTYPARVEQGKLPLPWRWDEGLWTVMLQRRG